jgi:hypothetical protein
MVNRPGPVHQTFHPGKARTLDERSPSVEVLLVEYQSAQADYVHNDALPWQMRSVLVAGAFVFWGLVLNSNVGTRDLSAASALVTVLMSIWYLFAHHYRQTYLLKLDRMHEIERELGMDLNRRWVDTPIRYRGFGPRGSALVTSFCLFAAGGAPLVAMSVQWIHVVWHFVSPRWGRSS